MKIIYRSAAKIRRQGSFYPWISAAPVQAASIFIQFTKSAGIASLIQIICSAVLIVLIIPIVGLLFFLKAGYKKIVQLILVSFYPDEQLEVVFDSCLRTIFDTSDDYGIVTVLVLVNGTPDIEQLRRKVEKWILSSPMKFAIVTKLLLTKFGCYVWKPTNNFKMENHVLLSTGRWKGRLINEDSLKNYVCELNSRGLSNRYPVWQIVVVPLNECIPHYALVVRSHHILANSILLNNLFPSNEKFDNKHINNNNLSTFCQSVVTAVYTLVNIAKCLIEIPSVFVDELTLRNNYLKRKRISGPESICWTDAFSLKLVEKIADKSGVNPNDVLTSCITGSLRHYYSNMEGFIPERVLGAIPCFVKCNNEKVRGFAPLSLPLTTIDSKYRLLQLHAESTDMRRATSVVKILLLNYIDRILPNSLAKAFLENMTKKYSCIISDYYIPSDFLRLFHDVRTMIYLWKPLIGQIGISFSLMYSKDKVAVAIKTDLSSIQRPDVLLSYFVREIKELAFDLNVREERQH